MLAYAGGRALQMVVVLVLSSGAIFALIRAVPGDPAVALAGPDATPEVVAAVRESLGLDAPLLVQYASWLGGALRGDFGISLTARRPVADLISRALPASVQLTLAALLISVVLGVVLGVLSSLHRGRWLDAVISTTTSAIIGVPAFWLGIIGLLVFSRNLGWLPAGGWVSVVDDPVQGLKSLTLPATAVGLVQGSVLARFMRASMLDVLEDDHVRTAHAKGLARHLVLRRHVFRNALIPVVTVIGAQAGNLLGGIVIVEVVFSWPGLGRLIVNAVGQRDYPTIQSTLLLLIAAFVVINLVVDLLYGYLDPRTRTDAP